MIEYNIYTFLIGVAGVLIVLIAMLLAYLTVLWAVLPFAIFGTKSLLKEMIENDEKIISRLELLHQQNGVLIGQNKKLVENTNPSRALR